MQLADCSVIVAIAGAMKHALGCCSGAQREGHHDHDSDKQGARVSASRSER